MNNNSETMGPKSNIESSLKGKSGSNFASEKPKSIQEVLKELRGAF